MKRVGMQSLAGPGTFGLVMSLILLVLLSTLATAGCSGDGNATPQTEASTTAAVVDELPDGTTPDATSTTITAPALGQIAYARNDAEIWMVDLDSGKSTHLATFEDRLREIYASPHGPAMAFCTSATMRGYTLWALNTSTSEVVNVAYNPGDAPGNAFSPDGQLLYFVDSGDDQLGVYDFRSKQRRILSQHPAANGFALSSDGTLLAYRIATGFSDREEGVVLMRTDGSAQMVTPRLGDVPAFFSSDNRYLYLGGGQYRVSVDPDLTLNTRENVGDRTIYADRGGHGLWHGGRPNSLELASYRIGSSGLEFIADLPPSLRDKADYHESFCLSPDGVEFAYQDNRNGDWDIYLSDGTRLTKDIGDETAPVWTAWPPAVTVVEATTTTVSPITSIWDTIKRKIRWYREPAAPTLIVGDFAGIMLGKEPIVLRRQEGSWMVIEGIEEVDDLKRTRLDEQKALAYGVPREIVDYLSWSSFMRLLPHSDRLVSDGERLEEDAERSEIEALVKNYYENYAIATYGRSMETIKAMEVESDGFSAHAVVSFDSKGASSGGDLKSEVREFWIQVQKWKESGSPYSWKSDEYWMYVREMRDLR